MTKLCNLLIPLCYYCETKEVAKRMRKEEDFTSVFCFLDTKQSAIDHQEGGRQVILENIQSKDVQCIHLRKGMPSLARQSLERDSFRFNANETMIWQES